MEKTGAGTYSDKGSRQVTTAGAHEPRSAV
jgi:hypothetical protein